jgi:protein tyrosine phosphatase (PTP) superfamily phosphohydrolase (DUF442 family)
MKRFLLLLAMIMLSPGAAADIRHDPHAGPAMNFRAIDQRLLTGGHFVGEGLEAMVERGVTVVIDLRPSPPDGRAPSLAARGIEWINIPVEWERPELEDFEAFAAAMDAHQGATILVQCQANYRASTMTYLYRVKVQGVDEATARKDLDATWAPKGTWRAYIKTVLGRAPASQ